MTAAHSPLAADVHPVYVDGMEATITASLPAGWAVETQQWARTGRKPRFAYVLIIPGEWAWVSDYRYGSAASARKAGMKDALDSVEYRKSVTS